jgi:hypothetical protein
MLFMKSDHSGCHSLRVLCVEPPKALWFVMDEYIPTPFGILILVAHSECKRDAPLSPNIETDDHEFHSKEVLTK